MKARVLFHRGRSPLPSTAQGLHGRASQETEPLGSHITFCERLCAGLPWNSHCPGVGPEHLRCGWCDCGHEFLIYLVLIKCKYLAGGCRIGQWPCPLGLPLTHRPWRLCPGFSLMSDSTSKTHLISVTCVGPSSREGSMSGGGEPPGRWNSILACRHVSQASKEPAGLGAAGMTAHSPNGHGDPGSGHRVSLWEHTEILTTAREGGPTASPREGEAPREGATTKQGTSPKQSR